MIASDYLGTGGPLPCRTAHKIQGSVEIYSYIIYLKEKKEDVSNLRIIVPTVFVFVMLKALANCLKSHVPTCK